METWLLVFFTAIGAGGTPGTQANYIQFKTEAECQSASERLASVDQKVDGAFRYSPVPVCVKNGVPVLTVQDLFKK